jgi:hypothetical protein
MNRPQKNNNPFAIMDKTPDKWEGLVYVHPDGFLQFKRPSDGVRAGFINLINAYLNRGLNTIEKIFPVYAPYGHGNNDPRVYINRAVQYSGLDAHEIIDTPEKIYKLGRAIVRHEEGKFWVNENDFKEGFSRAMKRSNIAIPTGSSWALVILVLIIAFMLIL